MNSTISTKPMAILQPPGRRAAFFLSMVVFALYCWYIYSGLGEQLYEWSKTRAPYAVREYLGMSKRFLWQYGHILFLFGLLVLSRYVFTSDRRLPLSGRVMDFVILYATPIFLFHFPILFFLAAVTDYDHSSAIQQLALLFSTLLFAVLLGRFCFAIKPAFDRWQKAILAKTDVKFPRPTSLKPIDGALTITRSHSEFLNYVKALAMICVVLGHFSFHRLTTLHIPGFDGAAPRFAVPAFFMISGYFLMMSIDRSRFGAMAMIGKRALSLYYIIIPMLVVTVILDSYGIPADPQIYDFQDYYTLDHLREPYAPWEIVAASVSSLLYLNSSWWFAFLDVHSTHGGMRAFSNDPYWFMCYLIPFSIMLIVVRLVAAPQRWAILLLWLVVFGLPILMLAPLFLSGSLAYFIHKHWGTQDAPRR
ncbi:MAG: acyltransferase family protein [Devosia sp.]